QRGGRPAPGRRDVPPAPGQPGHRGLPVRPVSFPSAGGGSGWGGSVKFGVVVFPGTWSDRDCGHVVEDVLGAELVYLWHKDRDLPGADCVLLPGGFSYGDYLRAGAIARFSPVMDSVAAFAAHGGLVWGICNGFQVLCEAGLLPGALVRNQCLEFRCQWTHLRCERDATPFTGRLTRGQVVRVPIAHGEGNYV